MTVISGVAPVAPAGATAMICVALFTVKLLAAMAPNFTAVTPVKFVPVISTLVPPELGPEVGLIEVIVGTDTTGVIVMVTLRVMVGSLASAIVNVSVPVEIGRAHV